MVLLKTQTAAAGLTIQERNTAALRVSLTVLRTSAGLERVPLEGIMYRLSLFFFFWAQTHLDNDKYVPCLSSIGYELSDPERAVAVVFVIPGEILKFETNRVEVLKALSRQTRQTKYAVRYVMVDDSRTAEHAKVCLVYGHRLNLHRNRTTRRTFCRSTSVISLKRQR